jgi:hypothetical protein
VQPGTNVPPRSAGVYIFVAAEPFERLRGTSDILYVGHCGNTERGDLNWRIAWYTTVARQRERDPHYASEFKIANYYDKYGDIKLGWLTDKSKDAAKEHEKRLLAPYERDHGELPLFNRQGAVRRKRGRIAP